MTTLSPKGYEALYDVHDTNYTIDSLVYLVGLSGGGESIDRTMGEIDVIKTDFCFQKTRQVDKIVVGRQNYPFV
jgi:hypothetical protein